MNIHTSIWKMIQNWINNLHPDEISSLPQSSRKHTVEGNRKKTVQSQDRQLFVGITIILGNSLWLPLQFVDRRDRIPCPRKGHWYGISHSWPTSIEQSLHGSQNTGYLLLGPRHLTLYPLLQRERIPSFYLLHGQAPCMGRYRPLGKSSPTCLQQSALDKRIPAVDVGNDSTVDAIGPLAWKQRGTGLNQPETGKTKIYIL